MADSADAPTFRPTYPVHMVWLATDLCNARCLHCSSNSARRRADELTTEEALRLVDELADVGVVDFAVSGGEPLLRPDLFRVVAHARRRGMAVGVGSNGAALPDRKLDRLLELGIGRLQVSLDGLDASHDRLRRWPGLFRRAVRNIHRAARRGLRVHVCCTVTSLNADELDAFVDFVVNELPVKRLNFSRFVPTGRGTDALDLPSQRWRAVAEKCVALRESLRGRLDVVTHLAQQVLVDETAKATPAFSGCQAGAGQGCVTANGTVQPCVLLPIPLGNIRARRFRSIWRESQLAGALRARRLDGRCASCTVSRRCGGCRAVAYSKTGSALASDPRCWLPDRWPREQPKTTIQRAITKERSWQPR